MKQAIKNGLSKLFRRFGYVIRRPGDLEHWSFSEHLSLLFQRLNIQCVLDVGANVGGYGNFLRNVIGYTGLILSFEPVDANLEALQELARSDRQWVVYDYALGSQNTTMEINVMKRNVFSSFLNPDNSVVPEFQDWNAVDHKERVEVRTLDSIMDTLKKKHRIQNIFLKMDTQGYDLEVVKGAEATLPQICALQTEVSLRRIYQNMPHFIDAYQMLNGKGFDITGMYPVSRDPLLRVIEYDCIMVNKKLEQSIDHLNLRHSGGAPGEKQPPAIRPQPGEML